MVNLFFNLASGEIKSRVYGTKLRSSNGIRGVLNENNAIGEVSRPNATSRTSAIFPRESPLAWPFPETEDSAVFAVPSTCPCSFPERQDRCIREEITRQFDFGIFTVPTLRRATPFQMGGGGAEDSLMALRRTR